LLSAGNLFDATNNNGVLVGQAGKRQNGKTGRGRGEGRAVKMTHIIAA